MPAAKKQKTDHPSSSPYVKLTVKEKRDDFKGSGPAANTVDKWAKDRPWMIIAGYVDLLEEDAGGKRLCSDTDVNQPVRPLIQCSACTQYASIVKPTRANPFADGVGSPIRVPTSLATHETSEYHRAAVEDIGMRRAGVALGAFALARMNLSARQFPALVATIEACGGNRWKADFAPVLCLDDLRLGPAARDVSSAATA